MAWYDRTYPKPGVNEVPHFCRFDGSNVLLEAKIVPDHYWNCQVRKEREEEASSSFSAVTTERHRPENGVAIAS
jgi:Uma2 family endonuclease